MSGVYIHIPFCKSKCPYCDFHSQKCDYALQKLYTESLVDEINTLRGVKEFLPSDEFNANTLYLGGGTPSSLRAEELEQILLTAKEKFHLPEDAEITVECNPSSDIEGLIPTFLKCGVNRVSLGMQSAVDKERRILGRLSDSTRVKNVINMLKANGIKNISLDIMLGVPEQTKESLDETLNFINECNIQHVSAYILKIEEGTFFHTHRERFKFPTDDEASDLYEYCCEQLEKTGFEQYEISNFAKKGFESRHNTKYWLLDDYLGIGAAAHSLVGGKRFYFCEDTQAFIDKKPAVFDCDGNNAEEYIMLRLRLKKGLNLSELETLYGKQAKKSIIKKAPFFKEMGLANYDGETLSLTRKGFLISNSIITELI